MKDRNRVEQVWEAYYNGCYIGCFDHEADARQRVALHQNYSLPISAQRFLAMEMMTNQKLDKASF